MPGPSTLTQGPRHDNLYPVSFLYIPTLTLCLVLALAAIGKLRDDDESTRAEWIEMGVPPALRRPALRHAHPYVELALVALVLLPGVLSIVGAVGMLVLTCAYLVLVVRAARSPDPVACACFGSSQSTVITGRTVARNVLLVVLAVLTLVAALVLGSPYGKPVGTGIDGSMFLMMLVIFLIVQARPSTGARGAVATAGARGAAAVPAGTDADPARDDAEEEDYVRTLTPRAPVVTGEGVPTDILTLSREAPQLLIFGSPGCAPCARLGAELPGYRERLPQVAVRMVTQVDVAELRSVAPAWVEGVLVDADGMASAMLQVNGTPTAVLLGTDGMLAGGPVVGTEAIGELVDDIADVLGDLPAVPASGRPDEPRGLPDHETGDLPVDRVRDLPADETIGGHTARPTAP